jgi:uncharacterized protein
VTFPGIGTAVNVLAVLVGSSLGLLLGARLPTRTRDTVTDALGLVTLLIGALSAAEVRSAGLVAAVGSAAPVLVVLGAMLIGGIAGSLLNIEARLEGFGGWLRTRLGRGFGRRRQLPEEVSAREGGSRHVPAGTSAADTAIATTPGGRYTSEPGRADYAARERFIEGFVTASLVFCVGPLTILGSLSDGLGRGADQLILKAVLDGFASIAFAASLGAGVMASVVAIVVVQGSLTLLASLSVACSLRPISRRSLRPAACSSLGSASGSYGSRRCQSATYSRRCWSRRCSCRSWQDFDDGLGNGTC